MKRRRSAARTLGIVILFSVFAVAATTFDSSADFSLQKNPTKTWQYGYSAGHSLDPSQFVLDKYVNSSGVIAFWHPRAGDQPGPGYYPYVAYNRTKQSQFGSSNGWAARAGEIAMEGSNTGQYSIVRFMAPTTGRYRVTARFEGIHFGLSTTDVHVLHNGESLFDADIDGYGGDPAFHKVQGANPTVAYSGEMDLQVNDTITFAVGYGKNKTNYGDTTGLFARVVLLSGTRQGK